MSNLFSEVFGCPTEDAQALASDILSRNGYAVEDGGSFKYGAGDIPILLVAHTDIVHDESPTTIYRDSAKRVVWSPTGIGADDRAGVWGIARLLADGYRPHVLFTDEEETGGKGAHEAAALLPAPEVNCMVQLDRMNATDAVYYSCDNPSFRKWITRRGFRTAQGSFTDISILMPVWGIAGVNVSVGYYGQHTTGEHLRLDELDTTLRKVARMLDKPPRRPFVYRERQSVFAWPKWSLAEKLAARDNLNANDTAREDEYDHWEKEYDRLLAERLAREPDYEDGLDRI